MKTKLLAVSVALMSVFGTANAGEGDLGFGAAVAAGLNEVNPQHFVSTYLPIAMLAPVVYAVLTDEAQPCDDLPIKHVKQTGANYLTAVTGCEAKYPG